eukprot:600377-Rhodomonas_salina.2
MDRWEKLSNVLARKSNKELVVLDPMQNEALIKVAQVDGLLSQAEDRVEKARRYYAFAALFLFAAVYTAVSHHFLHAGYDSCKPPSNNL